MTAQPAVPRLAVLLLLAGCGGDAPSAPPSPAPPGPEAAPEPGAERASPPPPEAPARAGYALHEWGLIGVETGSASAAVGTAVASAAEAASSDPGAAVRESNRRLLDALTDPAADRLDRVLQQPGQDQDGLGHLRPGATGKPVIYLHVPTGAPPVDVTLSLALARPGVLEHWPPAIASETALTWNMHAESGSCTSPAAAPTPADAACRDVRDGFCEAAEIPRYHGDDDTCLTVGGQQTPLLFYRGEGTDGSTMPLALRRQAPDVGSASSVDPGWEVVRQTDAQVDGIVMLALRVDGQPRVHVLQGPDYALPNATAAPTPPETARTMLHDEAVRRGLTAAEADAFVDAWAPAYFGEARREGPVATGRAPTALAEADRALLYFAPEALVDTALPLTLSPAPTVRHRVFLVRFVDATSRVDRGGLASAPAGSAPHMEEVGVGGGPMPGIRHPNGAPVRVGLGAPTVQGPLDSAIVRRVVARNQAQILHCYEQLLNRQPEASGRVIVEFVVVPSGSVSAASVRENATGDTGLASCIANAVRRWSYPEREAVTAVQFPFHLTLRD